MGGVGGWVGEAKPPNDLGKGKEEIVNIWKQASTTIG